MEGGRIDKPEEIYFFQREDGEVIHVNEATAWNLYNGRNRVIGQYQDRMKIIGVGSGEIFQKGLLESKELFRTQGIEAAQLRIRKAVLQELEACRGKIKIPRNYDSVDRRGNPINLSNFR